MLHVGKGGLKQTTLQIAYEFNVVNNGGQTRSDRSYDTYMAGGSSYSVSIRMREIIKKTNLRFCPAVNTWLVYNLVICAVT